MKSDEFLDKLRYVLLEEKLSDEKRKALFLFYNYLGPRLLCMKNINVDDISILFADILAILKKSGNESYEYSLILINDISAIIYDYLIKILLRD